MSGMRTHKGGCHCGAVAFEFDGPAILEAVYCNCSICLATGFLHHFVRQDLVRFGPGSLDAITDYQFNSRSAHHYFCSTCGIKSIYIPRSHPDCYSIHVNCLDQTLIDDTVITTFDGQNWEANIEKLHDT